MEFTANGVQVFWVPETSDISDGAETMERRWWETREVEQHRDGEPPWCKLSADEVQHVRDAFAYIDRIGFDAAAYPVAHELINRGTPPEPEWRKEPPDSAGKWERRQPLSALGGIVTEWLVTMGGLATELWMKNGETVARVIDINHDGYEYRRVGD